MYVALALALITGILAIVAKQKYHEAFKKFNDYMDERWKPVISDVTDALTKLVEMHSNCAGIVEITVDEIPRLDTEDKTDLCRVLILGSVIGGDAVDTTARFIAKRDSESTRLSYNANQWKLAYNGLFALTIGLMIPSVIRGVTEAINLYMRSHG